MEILGFFIILIVLILYSKYHRQEVPTESPKICSFPNCDVSNLLNHMNHAAFSCDLDGTIILLNNYAEESLGFRIGDKVPSEFLPKDVTDSLLDPNLNGPSPSAVFRVENANIYWVRLERRQKDGIQGFYGTIRDITDDEKTRYYTEMYLKQSGLAFLGSIFESLAHEIRTPCLAAEACYRMIQEDILAKLEQGQNLTKKDIEILRKYCSNGVRTTNQISELLNHSRPFRMAYREIELGDIELEECCTYCKETIEAAYNTIMDGRIHIHTCGSGPYLVTGYLNRFLESLGNILKNSVEAIVARSRMEPDLVPDIQIYLKSEEFSETSNIDQIITIEITDNGTGFKEDIKDLIGTAMFTTKSHDRDAKGTGLGLTLAIQTINCMGGTWEIRNRYEGDEIVGTKTTIKIPLPQQTRTIPSPF